MMDGILPNVPFLGACFSDVVIFLQDMEECLPQLVYISFLASSNMIKMMISKAKPGSGDENVDVL